MCAGKAETFGGACERAEHLCAFFYFETLGAEILQFLVAVGNGRCVDNQCGLAVFAGVRYFVNVFFVVNEHAFFFELGRERRGCFVVACHHHATTDEVAGDGAHANASGTNEIDCFNSFQFHNRTQIFNLYFLIFNL